MSLYKGSQIISLDKKIWNVTATASKWGTSVPYSQTIEVAGMKETYIVNVYPIWSETLATRKIQRREYNKLSMVTSADGSITLICDESSPTVDLDLRLEVTF